MFQIISLAMWINRIYTFLETREQRCKELKEMLINRDYRPGLIDGAISKARSIPREIALRKVVKNTQSKRPVAVVSWDPRLPPMDKIQQKHWRAMTALDPYLNEVYPEAPLVAYRRPKNIREFLIRAKLPPRNQNRPKRNLKGVKKCKNSCIICPYIKEVTQVKSENFSWKIESDVSCRSYNIVYMLICEKDNSKQKTGYTNR